MSKSPISRRQLLKILAAGAGAAVLSSVPNKWKTPVVELGMLPAHAQTSQTPGAISGTISVSFGQNQPIRPNAPAFPPPLTVAVVTPSIAGVVSPPTYDQNTNTDNYAYLISSVPTGTYTVRCTYNCGPTQHDVANVVVTAPATTPNVNFSFNACSG